MDGMIDLINWRKKKKCGPKIGRKLKKQGYVSCLNHIFIREKIGCDSPPFEDKIRFLP